MRYTVIFTFVTSSALSISSCAMQPHNSSEIKQSKVFDQSAPADSPANKAQVDVAPEESFERNEEFSDSVQFENASSTATKSPIQTSCKAKEKVICLQCCQEMYKTCMYPQTYYTQELPESWISAAKPTERMEYKSAIGAIGHNVAPSTVRYVARKHSDRTSVIAVFKIEGTSLESEIIADVASDCEKQRNSCRSTCL